MFIWFVQYKRAVLIEMDEGNENVMGVRQQFSQNQDWREQNKISTEEASEPRALRCFDMGEELIIPLFSNEDRIMGGSSYGVTELMGLTN